jgi:tRNA threonylcarbamoyladenosine modification (KEOPS) complex  Pcc1 subunit
MQAEASIRLKFKNKKHLTTLLAALKPEVNAPTTKRANVKLNAEGTFFVLTVEAEDTVSLRATLNAYLRWINSTVNVMELLEKT